MLPIMIEWGRLTPAKFQMMTIIMVRIKYGTTNQLARPNYKNYYKWYWIIVQANYEDLRYLGPISPTRLVISS